MMLSVLVGCAQLSEGEVMSFEFDWVTGFLVGITHDTAYEIDLDNSALKGEFATIHIFLGFVCISIIFD
jgi:hypothetical protein